MNTPILSIIVPVYNVEQYLPACVESVLSQDYLDYELVLIDDGSPDGCPAMCDEYVEKDSRVRVIHQRNAGLASVRNVGLASARGEYITFVDSDDLLAKGALEALMREMEDTNADIVLGEVIRFDENDVTHPYTRLKERRLMSGKETLCLLLEGRQLNISMCAGVYKKSVFNGARFPVGYICEDWYVTPTMYLNARNVVFLPVLWYRYRVNTESTMASLYKKPNPQVIDVAEHVIDVIRKSGDRQLYYETLWYNLRRVWNYIGRLYSNGKFCEEKGFVDLVRTQLRYYWKELKKSKKMKMQEKLGVWSFCYCKPFFKLLRRIK